MQTQNNPYRDTDGLIDALPALYRCDASGTITFYNKKAAELWGRAPVIGVDKWCGSWKSYHTDGMLLDLHESPMAMALIEGRQITGHEVIIERPDGSRSVVQALPEPFFDSEGKISGAVTMLIDITHKWSDDPVLFNNENKYKDLSELLEQKVAERTETLKKSEERYHKMIEEVEDYAILLLDSNGTILNWNLGAEKIKGYTEAEIVGKNFSTFYLPEDRERRLPQVLINQAAIQGKAMHEGWRLKKNGEKFWGFVVLTALHGNDGEIIGFSKVTRDLTERKEFEDQLKSYAKNIEFRNKQLEEYAHIASHDLQEPLRKIRTFAELLERKIDDRETALSYLSKINSSATRMTALIKDVLEYSQLSQTDSLYRETDLNELIANIKQDFELLIAEKKVAFVQSELPLLFGIPIQLEQLFSNLIGNSLKFSGEGAIITIQASVHNKPDASGTIPIDTRNGYVRLMVQDNGRGFDPQYASQIFKLFQRLSTEQQGTGIGLALCKKIVENHNGAITVTSEINVGTEFVIYLPVLRQ